MTGTARKDIREAHKRIRPYVRRTPVIILEEDSFDSFSRLVLKLEQLQRTGSFKPRGAFNKILSNPVPSNGVIAASGGNHASAVAYAAKSQGHEAEIFVPEKTPKTKLDRIRSYGAKVTIGGRNYQEALELSRRKARETRALEVHAYDDSEVLAGQGTIGLELEEQAPDLDTLLVAVGGGGLLGGIAAWYGDRVRVIGVEPERCPTLARALEAGEPVDVSVGGVAVDSLGATRLGELAYEIVQLYGVGSVLVKDEAIERARRTLWRELRQVAEPGGATALAALSSGAYTPDSEETVGVLISGGNTDPPAAEK